MIDFEIILEFWSLSFGLELKKNQPNPWFKKKSSRKKEMTVVRKTKWTNLEKKKTKGWKRSGSRQTGPTSTLGLRARSGIALETGRRFRPHLTTVISTGFRLKFVIPYWNGLVEDCRCLLSQGRDLLFICLKISSILLFFYRVFHFVKSPSHSIFEHLQILGYELNNNPDEMDLKCIAHWNRFWVYYNMCSWS